MRMRKVIVFTALLLGTLLTAATTAGAENKPKVNFHGLGTYVLHADGSAQLSGSSTGEPLDGSYEATLVPDDGTLPDPGACEPATGVVRLDGPRGRFLDLTSHGTVCGQYLQPPFVVTHVYTGRYLVTDAWRRPFVGTDGFVELRLTVDGRASAFAVDT